MVGSTVLLGNDVIDVESEEVAIVFVNTAIFTAAAGSASNVIPKRGFHSCTGMPD